MGSFLVNTEINAPVEQVWDALSAIGDIYQWNPGVQASHTTSAQAEGIGATRFCDLGGSNYLDEEVVAWQPNEKLTMRIVGTNLPFATADIRFTLQAGADGTTVAVSPQYQLKYGLLGNLLDILYVRRSYRRGMEALLAGLKRFVETGAKEAAKA